MLKESEFTRTADLHFILLLMATLENGGYFAQDREVENKIAKYNDEYKNKDHMYALLIKTFVVINDLDLPIDSMFFRKSNFFTLVTEIANHVNQLPENLKQRLFTLRRVLLETKIIANWNLASTIHTCIKQLIEEPQELQEQISFRDMFLFKE